MALIRHSDLRRTTQLSKSASSILDEAAKAVRDDDEFDVFLSHSYMDKDEILVLRDRIEANGLRVYVDWLVDGQLDRSKVTPATAAILRSRLKQCRALFYAFSENASISAWMPWELGYADGIHSKIAVVPIVGKDLSNFSGQEYLGLYPYLDMVNGNIFANNPATKKWASVRDWILANTRI